MRLYGSYAGFKYYIKPKPFAGAYVSMEGFARALLRYGHFDAYHTYFSEEFLQALTTAERQRAYFASDKLKVMKLEDLVRNPDLNYDVLHFERLFPQEEVAFRSLFSRKNIPVTRRVYAIATNLHLGQFLACCLLSDGGRPYDSIVVPSQPTRDAVMAYLADVSSVTAGRWRYRGRVDVIPHGIEVQEFTPRTQAVAREKFAIPADAVVVLSLARLSSDSKMNYDRLLTFFARLTTETEANLFLVLAGADMNHETPALLDAARELHIAHRIKFITDFKDESKADIFCSADIFVSLSDNLQESFGIALIEAMAMGLPVLCTDWDGYKDIVEDGVDGYRIPTIWKVQKRPQDVLTNFGRAPYDLSVVHRVSRDVHVDIDLLTARALELIHRPELRKEMGRRGREKVQREYSLRTEVARFEVLWNELGQAAVRDKQEYGDLRPLLNYDYPRHFHRYPTRFE